MSGAAARLLDRLERVKQTASGRWIARCPAHEDRSPSLSIRELPDGRVLIHCFGACATADVLAALGLSLSDLFDAPLDLDRRHALPPIRSALPARELLELIGHEVDVATLLLIEVLENKRLSEANLQRLMTASRRIGHARSCAYGNR